MDSHIDLSYKYIRSQSERMRIDLKNEWESLWKNKYDDERIAEGISVEDYSELDVEQGQVIYATRNCKQLNLKFMLMQEKRTTQQNHTN